MTRRLFLRAGAATGVGATALGAGSHGEIAQAFATLGTLEATLRSSTRWRVMSPAWVCSPIMPGSS